jgi:hypothetical protein
MMSLTDLSGGEVAETDIFLSYARQDRPIARIFAECLIEEGFTVWWDASLHSGETFDEVIEKRLRDAEAVIVLWSPRSVASRWVRAEATLADRRNKLAPAIIEPCDRPIIFELTHAAELCDWSGDRSDDRWQTFVHDLHRLVRGAEGADVPDAHRRPARPHPAAAKKSEAMAPVSARRPLRPGSDDVIVAERAAPVSALQHAPEADPQGEVHCLEIEDGELGGKLLVIDQSGVHVGRAAPAEVILSHKSISREHCMIGLANDELLVTDLNSTNGSYVDEVRIRRTTILPVGSVLRLGQVGMKHSIRTRAEAEQSRGEAGTGRQGRAMGCLAATR